MCKVIKNYFKCFIMSTINDFISTEHYSENCKKKFSLKVLRFLTHFNYFSGFFHNFVYLKSSKISEMIFLYPNSMILIELSIV